MRQMIISIIMTISILAASPVFAESEGITMNEENMQVMHENMAALSAELDEMRKAQSNDIKLRMMEKYMNQMHRQMRMMMDTMEGKRIRRHDHAKTKR